MWSVDLYVFMLLCAYMEATVDGECSPQLFYILFFLRQGPSLNLEPFDLTGLMANELTGSVCLCPLVLQL